MTVVVTGGLICSCGFQITRVWASDCKVFSGFQVAVVFILNFLVFFFMWILLFFWVYGFDLLEDSVEERDFE